VDAGGAVSRTTKDVQSFLLGLRYITPREITWVAEYYRNGAGYTSGELQDYFRFADTALSTGAPPQMATHLQSLAQSGYAKANPGRDYLYVKASASEPFNWLYTATALSTIVNLGDSSFQVTPEFTYTGFTNTEFRVRLILTSGGKGTEFGEKLMESRVEAYARFYF
jgi:hypothetical protein